MQHPESTATMASFANFGLGKRTAILLGLSLAVPGAMVAAQNATTPASLEVAAPADPTAQARALTATLRPELARFTKDSVVEDIEAAIIFVLNQGDYDDGVVNASFDQIEADPNLLPNVRQAIENIRRRLGRLQKGTGALNSGDGAYDQAGFSAPTVGAGGGSANYTQ